MSPAVLLAAVAGACAAVALLDGLGPALASGGARRHARAGAPRRGRALDRVAALGRRLGLAVPTAQDLAGRIDAAGLPAGVTPADVAALQAGGAALALAAVPLAAPLLPGRLALLSPVLLPAVALLVPGWWLRRRARLRARVLAEEVADVLDLLRVAVAAGLPWPRALGEVGRRRGGLLGGELADAADRIALGTPRAEALARLRRRCPVAAVAALGAAIGRADRHGVPLAGALVALAADARADRSRALQDRAARAAPKIQLVIALLLVPSVLLLVAAVLLRGLAG